MSRIILASQSPRRKDLMELMGLEFDVIPSNFDEYLDDDRNPEHVAIELAIGKAMAVAKDHPNDIVIGSDTIVTIKGKQLAKAENDVEAKGMLKLLSGTHNEVSTSLAVIRLSDNTKLSGADTATIYFRPYDEGKIDAYIKTGDYKDKAGAYGVQSGASTLIDYMSGSYDTVLGLPTKLLNEYLAKLGIDSNPVELTPPVRQK